MSDSFNESDFHQRVETSLSTIRTILSNLRNPTRPSDVPHTYDDKYGLAQWLVNICLCSSFNTLGVFGLDSPSVVRQCFDGVKNGRSVQITLAATEKCTFVKEATRKEESKTQYVTETTTSLGFSATETHKTVTKITEYFWNFEVDWSVYLSFGDTPSSRIPLNGQQSQRTANVEIITTVKETPHPQISVRTPIVCNLTWFFKQMVEVQKDLQFAFSIDRSSAKCRTPRRNDNVAAALDAFDTLSSWATQVKSYFTNHIFPIQTNHGLNLSAISTDGVFNPVVALFESKDTIEAKMNSSKPEEKGDSLVPFGNDNRNLGSGTTPPLLSPADVNVFLAEEKRSLLANVSVVLKTFPLRTATSAKLISACECTIVLGSLHLSSLAHNLSVGLDFIEWQLRQQLVAAIGKVVQPADFHKYMKYHANKIFQKAFRPLPFCFAVRRPDHYPEGTLAVEQRLGDGSEIPSPCFTHCRSLPQANVHPMSFAISASTRIAFRGQRYLHALVGYQFEGVAGAQYQLVARTRQFSSFLLMIGTIESPVSFAPKSAIILQNKDELTIPLLLEQLPSAREFRDQIESLSPEQQRFAKAYRQMQLDSSLFAILCVQLKPQLEVLTRLPYDSLTKEIKLTQDLLEMFIKYQIPSDLLTFDGEQSSSNQTKLNQVKQYITTMRGMIDEAKSKQLNERKDEAIYSVVDSIATTASVPAPSRAIRPLASGLQAPLSRSSPRAYSASKSALASAPISSFASGPPPPPSPAPAHQGPPLPSQPPAPPETSPPQETKTEEVKEKGMPEESSEGELMDYTALPRSLDSAFLKLDEDGALRTTTITTGPTWTKKSQKSLLSDPTTTTMGKTEQTDERNRAFDLLDALSRSGVLSLDHCELHVVVAATHCFDKSLINTIIQDNVNPIEKVEKSNLILAGAIQDKRAQEMVTAAELARVTTYSPKLFIEDGKDKTAVVASKK